MTNTQTRATFVTALSKIDDAMKVERAPIGARAVFLAIEKARESWAAWSPARRPQARADHEAVLRAELAHARSDFLRLADQHKALDLFDLDNPHVGPDERYRLPRERAAAAALNALMHASIQTRVVSDDLLRLRGQRLEAVRMDQSAEYRESWANVAAGTLADLPGLIRRRRRDWQRALQLIAAYEKETAT